MGTNHHDETYTSIKKDTVYTKKHHGGNCYSNNYGPISQVNYGTQLFGENSNKEYSHREVVEYTHFNHGCDPSGHHHEHGSDGGTNKTHHSTKTHASSKAHSPSSAFESKFKKKMRDKGFSISDSDSD